MVGTTQGVAPGALAAAFALGLLRLPAPMLPSRWLDTHPLDGPCGSLLREYIGNIAYALALRHLSVRTLGIIVALSAILTVCGVVHGSLDQGAG